MLKSVSLGFSIPFLVVASIITPLIWPPELSILFNNIFWWSSTLLLLSIYTVFRMLKGVSSEALLFTYAVLLIISSTTMFSGFEQVANNSAKWMPHFRKEYPTLSILLPQFIEYAKNLIAFGFVAIGSGVCAGIICQRYYKTSGRSFS